MIAADRERVAVAGHDPDREVGTRGGDTGGKGRGAPVDAVHPVGVHVVDEATGAADARYEHDLVRRDAELRHEPLDGGEDGVVAAAGTPARLLIGGEVRLGELQDVAAVGAGGVAGHLDVASVADGTRARICSIMSRVKIGSPSTLVKLSQSTRNSARRTFTSCPVFISGTSTRSWERSTSSVLPGSGRMCLMWAVATFAPCSRRTRRAAP